VDQTPITVWQVVKLIAVNDLKNALLSNSGLLVDKIKVNIVTKLLSYHRFGLSKFIWCTWVDAPVPGWCTGTWVGASVPGWVRRYLSPHKIVI